MKKTGMLLLFLLILTVGSQVLWAGGQRANQLTRVNVGIHGNAGGATLVAVAMERGYFAQYGIDPRVTVVESGPVQMAAMRADSPTLDIGYIGPGVAWNPIDSTGNSLSFVFFDNIGNSERLLAREGIFVDSNNNGRFDHAELHAGLRGRTVFMELGTTSGVWFMSLIEAINEGFAPQDQLWVHSEDAAFLAGYTAPNDRPENRVTAVNFLNSNIPAGMATTGSSAVDIAVAFEPVPSTVLRNVMDVEEVADISSLPEDMVFPATFVAVTRWLETNPELARNFIFALYRAALWRAENQEESLRMGERLSARPEGTFIAGTHFFPGKVEFQEWFANPNARGYDYLRSLYNARLPNVPAGSTPKPFDQAFDLTHMLRAIAEIQ